MTYEEKTMKSEKVYEGKIINLRIDTVELPDKKYTKREIVEHPGAVAIVAINENNEVILVKQFRKPIEKELLEIPAGKIEVGEDPRTCAERELKEETGFEAGTMDFLFEFYTSPGFSNEKMYLFIAKELKAGEANPESDEYIEIERIKLNELASMVDEGIITDSKTIIGILKTRDLLTQ